MSRLTKRSVDAARAPNSGQEFLWDGELRGFGVRIVPSGLKTFIIQYRTLQGQSRRVTLGRYGIVTVEQAREQAKIKLGQIAAGADPAQERADIRKDVTVAALCDWYLTEARAGRILGRRNRPIKASTLDGDKSRIETHIKPLLGNRLAKGLRISDVEGMQSDIVLGKTAKARGSGRGGVARGGVGVAGRAVGTLQSILSHGLRLDQIEKHPTRGARKLTGTRKKRRLNVDELRRLGGALRHAEAHGEHPTGTAVVRLLLMTGLRISEGQRMERAWFDAERSWVAFPDTKGDAQIRAIGRQAVLHLEAQPVCTGTPFVFPGDFGEGPFTAAKACLARLCAMAGIAAVTPHTLRHTFGSVAGDLGFSELVIAALLGHSAVSVTQGYVHVDEALKLAADRTCGHIAALLDGE
jgi:integrase